MAEKYEHLKFEQVLEFINAGEPTDENIDMLMEVGRHINECEECLRKVRIVRGMEGLFEKWTANTHELLYKRLHMNRSMLRLSDETDNKELKDRLLKWLEKHAGRAASAMQLQLNIWDERLGRMSRIMLQPAELLTTSASGWNFVYDTIAVPSRGGIIRKKVENKVIDADKAGTEVKLDGNARAVRIKLRGISDEGQAPIALLIPEDEARNAIAAFPHFDADEDSWVISFNEIEEGEYMLLFEPK